MLISVLSRLINFMDRTQQINVYFIGNAEMLTDMWIKRQNNVSLLVEHKDMRMDTVSMTTVLGIYDQYLYFHHLNVKVLKISFKILIQANAFRNALLDYLRINP